MGLDRIDLLLIHRPDPLMNHHETGAALDEVVEGGKVRAVGVSNFMPWDLSLLQSAMRTRLSTNQIELSLSAHQPFTDGQVAALQERGLPVMAWSPLGGGNLVTGDSPLSALLQRLGRETGTDASAVAVAWLLAHPARIRPVMGTNTLDRIRGLSRALDLPMDRQTWFELYTAALGREVP
jgi:predicted oxidoreductase